MKHFVPTRSPPGLLLFPMHHAPFSDRRVCLHVAGEPGAGSELGFGHRLHGGEHRCP